MLLQLGLCNKAKHQEGCLLSGALMGVFLYAHKIPRGYLSHCTPYLVSLNHPDEGLVESFHHTIALRG